MGKWSLTLNHEQTLENDDTIHLCVEDQAYNRSIRDYQVQVDPSAPDTLIVSPIDSVVIPA